MGCFLSIGPLLFAAVAPTANSGHQAPVKQLTESPRIAVIGAGPAGEEVAIALAAHRVHLDIFDENRRPGGNVGRILPTAPETRLERHASKAPQVRLCLEAKVLRITQERCIEYEIAGRIFEAHYDAIFLCCGAYDGQLPLPGTPSKNVITVGALQALSKGHGIAPAGDVVLAGAGPFLYVVAAELLKKRCRVRVIVDRLSAGDYLRLGVGTMGTPANGIEYAGVRMRLHQSHVKILRRARILKLDQNGLVLNSGRLIRYDHLAITDFFIPQTQLARTAACRLNYNRQGGYFVVETDRFGRSSVPGVYVCGEGQGIRGWRHAKLSGCLAAKTALSDLGIAKGSWAIGLRRRLWLLRQFAQILERRLHKSEPESIAPNAILCACESTTARVVSDVVKLGIKDLPTIKSLTRCGMGPCQGRYCEALLCRVLEQHGLHPQLPLTQNTLVHPMTVEDFIRDL